MKIANHVVRAWPLASHGKYILGDWSSTIMPKHKCSISFWKFSIEPAFKCDDISLFKHRPFVDDVGHHGMSSSMSRIIDAPPRCLTNSLLSSLGISCIGVPSWWWCQV